MKGLSRGIDTYRYFVLKYGYSYRVVGTGLIKPVDLVLQFQPLYHSLFHDGLYVRRTEQGTSYRVGLGYPELSVFWNVVFPRKSFGAFKQLVKGGSLEASDF